MKHATHLTYEKKYIEVNSNNSEIINKEDVIHSGCVMSFFYSD